MAARLARHGPAKHAFLGLETALLSVPLTLAALVPEDSIPDGSIQDFTGSQS
jgi:hypothetical protein